jgi:hypothetical protein
MDEFEAWFETLRQRNGWPVGWGFLTVIRAACREAWDAGVLFS